MSYPYQNTYSYGTPGATVSYGTPQVQVPTANVTYGTPSVMYATQQPAATVSTQNYAYTTTSNAQPYQQTQTYQVVRDQPNYQVVREQPNYQVVSTQPTRQYVTQRAYNPRDWSTGLCGCFEDINSCCCATWCYPCFLGTLARQMGENPCGPCCCGGACKQLGCFLPTVPNPFLTAMRTKMRMNNGIDGDICGDSLTTGCCECCAAMQMSRQLRHLGVPSASGLCC